MMQRPDCKTPEPDIESLLARCVRCGFCNASCPTYLQSGEELEGPRGRIQLISAMERGDPVSRKTQEHLDRCLTCLSCERHCPSGVQYGALIDHGRVLSGVRIKRRPIDAVFRHSLALLVGHSWLIGLAMPLVRPFRSLLPESLSQYLPLTLDRSPMPRAHGRVHSQSILLLEGCIQQHVAPGWDDAFETILDRLGMGLVRVRDGSCCGAVAHHLGYRDLALRQWQKRMGSIKKALRMRGSKSISAVVMTSSGCGLRIREILKDRHPDEVDHPLCGIPVLDPLEVLESRWEELRSMMVDAGAVKTPVRLHEPCTLQNGLGLKGRLADFLRAISIPIEPSDEGGLCCGSGGTHPLFQPELARSLRERKRQALGMNDKAQEVLSSNIGCILHLSDDEHRVKHWLTYIAQCLESGNPISPSN